MMRVGGLDVDADISTPVVDSENDLGVAGAKFFARADDICRTLARAACVGELACDASRVDALLDPQLEQQRAGAPITVERRGEGVVCAKYLPKGYVSSSM